MINELLPYSIGISVSYPLPGTKFYENVKTELREKTNWTDSDELMLMFRNTYQPVFYKQLYRYVHKSHRLHVALEHLKNIFIHPASISLKSIRKALSVAYYSPAELIAKLRLNMLENA